MQPPRLLESLFRILLPPAVREHVLGDLHERCTSPAKYCKDGLSVLAPVIVSRIRRMTDFQVFFMEFASVYLSFLTAPWLLGDKALLYSQDGLLRLAIPAVVTAAGLLLCNAYSDSQTRFSPVKSVFHAACSSSLAFLGQMILAATDRSLGVPLGITVCGCCLSLILVSTLRMLFPPNNFSNWTKR